MNRNYCLFWSKKQKGCKIVNETGLDKCVKDGKCIPFFDIVCSSRTFNKEYALECLVKDEKIVKNLAKMLRIYRNSFRECMGKLKYVYEKLETKE